MQIKSNLLLNELTALTLTHISFAETLKQKEEVVLNKRLSAKSWSVLECMEHLNRYGTYYLPEIKKQIEKTNTSTKETFKSGWLGNYFANSMLPKENLNKMKTFQSMNPINSKLSSDTIDVFIDQQKQLLNLLRNAQNVNLNKVRIKTSISMFLKLKLGDTFRFVIYHNKRHVLQAQKIVDTIS